AGRTADAARELQVFEEIKKRNENASVPENMEWSYYAELYDPRDPAQIRVSRTASNRTGAATLDFDGDGRADLIVWSAKDVQLFKDGTRRVAASGLEGLTGTVFIAPGDFDNDGFADLCVVTERGAFLYRNVHGKFEQLPVRLPSGQFNKAVWLDYDHDDDLDLFLLGGKSALARNNGEAGFSDETARFPFAEGN